MAGSVNKVILIGNVGKDPEIRSLNSGSRVASFTMATSESWRDKSTGEKKEKTEWHRIVIFNDNLVKIVEQYVKKGAKLYVEGQLQTRKWADNAGVEKYTTEVVLQSFNSQLTFLESANKSGASAGGYDAAPSDEFGQSSPMARPAAKAQGFTRDLDDEVPF